MKFWDLQYRKNTPNLGGIKMKKNLKSFGYKLKKNAILLSLLLGSAIIAGCKQPNGGDDYDDEIVTPVTPDNPTNPTDPSEPTVDPDPTDPDTPNPPSDDKNLGYIYNSSDLYETLAKAEYETYQFKSTNNKVDTAKLVLAKKLFGDKLADFTETNVNYILDFSNKSFANTTDEIESRSEYVSKKGISKSENVISDENLTETIKIGNVEFITKPIYNGESGSLVQQAFKFDKGVGNVTVSFGNSHSMTEAYKGGIILENSNAKITSDDVNSATLTGYVYAETMNGLSDNSLISRLTKDSDLPILNFKFVFLNDTENFYGTGVDKIFENYYNKGASDKILVKYSSAPFDAKDALNGGYMYDKNGNYNNNAYGVDINTALLMAEKLTNEIQNVNISGNVTSDVDTDLTPSNVRFSGDVSGLKFTIGGDAGIIDFAKVGPRWIAALNSKIIVNGVKNDGVEKGIFGYAVDFSNVDEGLLNQVSVKATGVDTVYTKTGSFSGSYVTGVHFKSGSSASTNQAWEKKGRGETVSNNELISKLDVKAKANNPLLQKLLDENQHVYG